MNDKERLEQFRSTLSNVEGLSPPVYERLMLQLKAASQPFGIDADGKSRVTVFDARTYDTNAFNQLEAADISWHYVPAALSMQTVGAAEDCRVVCIFVNDTCDRHVVNALAERGVGLIALRCAGFNHVDLDACRENSISVVRVPAYSPAAVAEHAVALMLMLNRKLHQAYLRNRAGAFLLDGLTGFVMRGKTVGVVGTGAIGSALANIVRGFGCDVLCYDKYPNEELKALPGVDYVDLDSLLSQSDIISLHVPLFTETRYLINDAAIEKMKSGTMLVNTSRGGLVDTKALIRGLKSGKIGSAGLDVYEEEAGVFFHDRSGEILDDDVLARLMTFNNVVITSHQAFLTAEALHEIARTTLENIREYIAGKSGGMLVNHVP